MHDSVGCSWVLQARSCRMNMSLGKLGRKVHLTQRALVQVLKELESWEELPTASRRTLKRARAAETASCSTSAFGNVMQDFTFRRENGEEVQIPVLHPAAMLTYVCQRSSAFADFLAGAAPFQCASPLAAHPVFRRSEPRESTQAPQRP